MYVDEVILFLNNVSEACDVTDPLREERLWGWRLRGGKFGCSIRVGELTRGRDVPLCIPVIKIKLNYKYKDMLTLIN